MRKFEGIQHNPEMVVSTNCVSQIVDNLECGKSAGPDGICAEHLKFSNDKISILLALCFIVHSKNYSAKFKSIRANFSTI